MSFIKQMSDEDILALFNASDDYYVKSNIERNEVNRIIKGNVTEQEKAELISRYRNIILKRVFNSREVLSKEMSRAYFPYAPSPLVDACTVSNCMSLEVPVIKYDNNGIKASNTFSFDTTSSEKVIAEVSETLVQDQDLINIFTELLNSEVNLKVREVVENTLESNVTLSANSIVEAVSKIDSRHIDNLSIVMSPANYLDSSFLPKIENFKIPVYFANVDSIYVGNLKAAIHVNFVQDKFDYDRDIKKGTYTLVNSLFSLGAVVKDASAIVKIV